ncbi:hypothetical protein D3C80_750890 [compost metagenome]
MPSPGIRLDDRFAELQRETDTAKRRIAANIGSPQRITAGGDKSARHIGSGTQDWRDLGGRTANNQFDVSVLFAIAANCRLDHLFRRIGHADRTHIASRMGTHIADRIQDLGAENGGRQPAVQRR